MFINVFLLLFFYLLAKYSKNTNNLTSNLYFFDNFMTNIK